MTRTTAARPATVRPPGGPASPWRRLAAFAVDYLAIALYAGVLAAVVLTVARPLVGAIRAPWQAHLLGVATMTLPVVLYSALAERFAGATLGKRLLGLRVATRAGGALPLGRSLVRNAAKFAPWELAHAAVHRVAGWPAAPGPLAAWQVAAFSLSLGVAALYVIALFVGRGRPRYDRLSGAVVRGAPIET